MVGAVRFELTTSCTRNKRASRATLRPDVQPGRSCRLRRRNATMNFLNFSEAECGRYPWLRSLHYSTSELCSVAQISPHIRKRRERRKNGPWFTSLPSVPAWSQSVEESKARSKNRVPVLPAIVEQAFQPAGWSDFQSPKCAACHLPGWETR